MIKKNTPKIAAETIFEIKTDRAKIKVKKKMQKYAKNTTKIGKLRLFKSKNEQTDEKTKIVAKTRIL